METEKCLSVIVPVYNAEQYLRPCLDSILGQTYHNLEILCINDGSSDHSGEILEEYARKDPRVRAITQANAGVSAARNRGIDAATGAYLTFVDSDDALAPEMYHELIWILEKENAEIAHCGYRRYELDGMVKDINGTKEYLLQTSEEAVACLLRGEKYIPSLCNKVYRRELFEDTHFVDGIRYNEDLLLNVFLFHKAKTIVFYDVPLYLYYIRSGSATSIGAQLVKRHDCSTVAERIWDLLKDTSLKEDAANKLFLAYVGEYRALVYAGLSEHRDECRELAAKADRILPMCTGLSAKQRLNYRLLRITPGFYKSAYHIYDKIRKPNWDVN